MTSKEAIMIQNKTQKIIESLWQCDFSPLLKHIAKDVTLIDPGRHILIKGREKILALLPQISEDISQSTVRRHTVMIAQNCGNACTIIGQYELDDGRSIAEVLAERTRSEVVQVIGKKIVLYKPAKDEAKRKIVLP